MADVGSGQKTHKEDARIIMRKNVIERKFVEAVESEDIETMAEYACEAAYEAGNAVYEKALRLAGEELCCIAPQMLEEDKLLVERLSHILHETSTLSTRLDVCARKFFFEAILRTAEEIESGHSVLRRSVAQSLLFGGCLDSRGRLFADMFEEAVREENAEKIRACLDNMVFSPRTVLVLRFVVAFLLSDEEEEGTADINIAKIISEILRDALAEGKVREHKTKGKRNVDVIIERILRAASVYERLCERLFVGKVA